MKSFKGHFLISKSDLFDPNFHQTVVLLLEHNQEGAFGLIVNRASNYMLSDVAANDMDTNNHPLPLYLGGPVQPEYLFVLHSEMPNNHEISKQAFQVVNNLYFEPLFDQIAYCFKQNFWDQTPIDDRPHIHLFLGYSGWGAGQLETEMKEGTWMTHPAHSKIVFHPNPEEGWRLALREKGGIYKVFANSNQNPDLN